MLTVNTDKGCCRLVGSTLLSASFSRLNYFRLFELAHGICIGQTLFQWLISDYMHPDRLGYVPQSILVSILFTASIAVCGIYFVMLMCHPRLSYNQLNASLRSGFTPFRKVLISPA
jgi:hypothetical protein